MNDYNIELFERLDNLRNEFDIDNIYCYYLLTMFINEIFIENEQSSEIFLSLQENLKVTIEAILTFNGRKDVNNFTLKNIKNFDITNTEDFLDFLNTLNNYLDKQNNYFIKDNTLINFIEGLLQLIIDETDNGAKCKENNLIHEVIRETLPEETFFNKINHQHNQDCKKYFIMEEEEEATEEAAEENIIKEEYSEKLKDIVSFLEDLDEEGYENIIFSNMKQTEEVFNGRYENSLNNLCNKNPKLLKEYIIRNNLLTYVCSCCGIDEWNNEKLPLFLHFKDGDINNKELENLEFLCPNCNAVYGSGIDVI